VTLLSVNITVAAGGSLLLDSSFGLTLSSGAFNPDAFVRLVLDPGTLGEIVIGEDHVLEIPRVADTIPYGGAISSGDPVAVTPGLHTLELQWRTPSGSFAVAAHASIRAIELGP
jgi:hypothetical protein